MNHQSPYPDLLRSSVLPVAAIGTFFLLILFELLLGVGTAALATATAAAKVPLSSAATSLPTLTSFALAAAPPNNGGWEPGS